MKSKILLAHGSGGKLSQRLVQNSFVPSFSNPILNELGDSAVFELSGRLAFTTDSYTVNPIFFPGGDIGRLAICGTVNDLAMSGATPRYLSLSFIIEEGLPFEELEIIINSARRAAEEAGVEVVTGDTKVVNRGNADKLFINTSGLGIVPPGVNISAANAVPGDKIILSGTHGDHGIAILSQREGLDFHAPIQSDCAPLNKMVADIVQKPHSIHCLRDPTRGGIATTLNEFAERSQVGIRIDETKIPIKKAVASACELLGLEPLYVANEGKAIAIVSASAADSVLSLMKRNKYGLEASIIGEVVAKHPGQVVMKTRFGSSRIVDTLTGELLPRIC